MKTLVTYATKYGATAEIAERIGEVLATKAGFDVTIEAIEQVDDIAPYDAVVLGSAVYVGKWRKEATAFLKDNEAALASRPVWLFSSGPTGEGDPAEIMDGWQFPETLQETADRINPREIVVFHGNLDPDKLNLVEKVMIKGVGAPTGDARDWDAITAWAKQIASQLKKDASALG